MIDAQIDLSLKALAQELFIRRVHGDHILRLVILGREELFAVALQLPAHLQIWEEPGPASAASQRAAQGGGAGGSIAVRVSVRDDQDILMRQKKLCAVYIIHRSSPRPV